MLITGCFEAHKDVERPRYAVYNALTLAAGLALGGVGYAVAADQYNDTESDGVGGFAGVLMATGGAIMTIGGLGGVLEAWLCSAPCR